MHQLNQPRWVNGQCYVQCYLLAELSLMAPSMLGAVKCSLLTRLGLAVCSSGPKPNLTTFKPAMNHIS